MVHRIEDLNHLIFICSVATPRRFRAPHAHIYIYIQDQKRNGQKEKKLPGLASYREGGSIETVLSSNGSTVGFSTTKNDGWKEGEKN